MCSLSNHFSWILQDLPTAGFINPKFWPIYAWDIFEAQYSLMRGFSTNLGFTGQEWILNLLHTSWSKLLNHIYPLFSHLENEANDNYLTVLFKVLEIIHSKFLALCLVIQCCKLMMFLDHLAQFLIQNRCLINSNYCGWHSIINGYHYSSLTLDHDLVGPRVRSWDHKAIMSLAVIWLLMVWLPIMSLGTSR